MSYNEDQMAEMRDTFSIFDKKGDGKIEIRVLGDVIRALGYNPTQADVKRYASGMGPDHRISFEEFLPIVQAVKQYKEPGSYEEYVEGLRVFDKDGNGTINSAELRHVLTTLGERLSDDEVEQLLSGFEDAQGQINYEEFIKMVQSN
ncbi:myosin-2 essential light chain-like [Saccoglossus kowalevskii]|uniref:Myosin-2 essential light chain-like n=1 Tax=Saccoglossus kowalevskii TaxID=10224 RepID=A0ABM0GWE4_SACKO|nr:PREDICTED: myosin-2 essential light chain-like [Saccoglossus kowalevskii]